MYIFTDIYVCACNKELMKEVMNLKESKKGYVGRLVEGKEREKFNNYFKN